MLLRRHITASFSWNFPSDEGLYAQEHHFTTAQPKGDEDTNNQGRVIIWQAGAQSPSKASDGTKPNRKHEFVTGPLLDGFRAGFSDITSFSVLKVTSSILGTLVITPGDRTEMIVGEGVWKRQWGGFLWHFYWHSKLWLRKASSTYLVATCSWLLMLLPDRLLRGFAYLLQWMLCERLTAFRIATGDFQEEDER